MIVATANASRAMELLCSLPWEPDDSCRGYRAIEIDSARSRIDGDYCCDDPGTGMTSGWQPVQLPPRGGLSGCVNQEVVDEDDRNYHELAALVLENGRRPTGAIHDRRPDADRCRALEHPLEYRMRCR